jgi:hypothetical protein
MDHIATGRALSPGGELLPPHHRRQQRRWRWQRGRWRWRRRRWRPMEMVPGAPPHPGRVPEQRLLSPKIRRRWRRSCGTLLEISSIVLGFFVPRLLIGEGASSGVDQGASPQVGVARAWVAPHGGEGALWPLSGSRLVLVLHPGKIGVWVFVSSNSENISCVAFLKHKIEENGELTLWHLVNRLVPEIA